MRISARMWQFGVLAAVVVGVEFVYWPGLYRYGVPAFQPGVTRTRTNRLTGAVQIIRDGEWKPLRPELPKNLQALPGIALSEVTGEATQWYGNSFGAKLYNGSSWRVYEIEYEITTSPKDALDAILEGVPRRANGTAGPGPSCTGWTRRFRRKITLAPYSAGSEFFDVGGNIEGCSMTWRIANARGVQADDH